MIFEVNEEGSDNENSGKRSQEREREGKRGGYHKKSGFEETRVDSSDEEEIHFEEIDFERKIKGSSRLALKKD